MTERLGKVLPSIINHCQTAFVPGHHIQSHILLAYELLKGYKRKEGNPRIMMQINLKKAYDMVNWQALKCILMENGIPRQFICWIMASVSIVSYKLNVNGEYTNFLQAKREIR